MRSNVGTDGGAAAITVMSTPFGTTVTAPRGARLQQAPVGLRVLRDDEIRRAHGDALEQRADDTRGPEVLAPVRRAPHLVPRDDERDPLDRRDDPEREEREVRHLVGFDRVEAVAEHPQAARARSSTAWEIERRSPTYSGTSRDTAE